MRVEMIVDTSAGTWITVTRWFVFTRQYLRKFDMTGPEWIDEHGNKVSATMWFELEELIITHRKEHGLPDE